MFINIIIYLEIKSFKCRVYDIVFKWYRFWGIFFRVGFFKKNNDFLLGRFFSI